MKLWEKVLFGIAILFLIWSIVHMDYWGLGLIVTQCVMILQVSLDRKRKGQPMFTAWTAFMVVSVILLLGLEGLRFIR